MVNGDILGASVILLHDFINMGICGDRSISTDKIASQPKLGRY